MRKICLLTICITCLLVGFSGSTLADDWRFEYPNYMVDIYNPEGDCWRGMAADGHWKPPVYVAPEKWLVGPPPSQLSGVTFPADHWVELMFRGRIVDGPGDDILIIEAGQCGEQALVFLTDGGSQEYLLGMATAVNTGNDDITLIGFDISGISVPFVPSAIKILAIDMGGGSPGFDIANIRARVSSGCGSIACRPYPPDGAVKVSPDAVLSWSPGRFALGHVVYFGPSFSDVSSGAASVAIPAQDANAFDPGTLQLGNRYYWRIDEVSDPNTGNVWAGDIWTFTVADHVVLDDFESYDYRDNPVYDTWFGYGWAAVGLTENPFRSCWQAMSLGYYYDTIYRSEAVRAFSQPQDWPSMGAGVLETWFHGTTGNATDGQMYAIIGDDRMEVNVPYSGSPNNVGEETWHSWRIDLQSLPDVNLHSVEMIGIGFRSKSSEPGSFGRGTVYFDDIRLYRSICLEEGRPNADFNADCVVDFEDFEEMGHSWRQSGLRTVVVTAPKPPVAWYEFDGNTEDSAGSADGQIHGSPSYVSGVYGRAISFDKKEDYVSITAAAELFSKIEDAITIAFWQYGKESGHLSDTICCSNYTYGESNPAIAINLGCWRPPGRYNWDCGDPWSFGNRVSGHHRYSGEWTGRWNHWAFTKDTQTGEGGTKGRMQIFLNGMLYDSRTGTTSPISGVTSFQIGSGWYGGYDGLIDDFRIYDYALSQPEVAYIATNGMGVFNQKLISPADMNHDNKIDFRDLARFAESWLDNQLWP